MSDYIIKSGENLSRIAKAHGTTVGEIMKNNPQIKDANSIFTGDTLNLPEKVAPQEDFNVPGLSIEHKPQPQENAKAAPQNTPAVPQNDVPNATPDKAGSQSDVTPFLYGFAGAAMFKAGEEAMPYIKEGAQKAADKAKSAATHAKDVAKQGYHKAGEVAHSAKEAVKSGAKSAAQSGKAAAGAVSKGAGYVAPTLKAVGKIAKPVAAAVVTLDVVKAYKEGGTKAAVKQGGVAAASIGGAWAGAKGGAAVGAAIGSVVPGIGTAAGAVVGGIVGSIGGWIAGEKISKAVIK